MFKLANTFVQHSSEQIKEMELKFDHSNTKVKQMADFIHQSISSNEYKVGESLPSINYLSKKYNVSRDTVFKAFLSLKEKGIIESIHGKSYYVAHSDLTIFLLLDEYSPFKETLYNRLVELLPDDYKVDLWFHQYNENLFNTIISDAKGRYAKYLIMNYDNDRFSEVLRQIDKNRLLLLDFGNFEKDDYSYICQDFEQSFYDALDSLKDRLRKYKKLVFVFHKKHKHPQSSKDYFVRFCHDNNFEYEILNGFSASSEVEVDNLYIVIKQEEIVNIIKQGRAKELKPGVDYGLIAYNESPFYEIIENGISSISVDFQKMGEDAAEFILTGNKVQKYLPTEVKIRDSI